MDNLERFIPRVGDRIQRYELVELIGRGGFGMVFRARQAGLDEDVAVKLLLPDGGDLAELQTRFEQEAKLSKELKHPAAIKVRDFGRTPQGLPFIVSEFIEGRDLQKVIYNEPMSAERIVRIASQILGCLAEAHFRGIVHRDLKPPNIMVRDIFGEPDSVKVLDFGIAKVSQQIGGLKTRTGLALGTPYYMSPEQCRGLPDLDGRADLYSLGLIIAECVGRKPVVQGHDTMAVVYAHARSEPHEFLPEVTQSPLFPLIWKSTQKERDRRYPDALSMRTDLMAVMGGGTGLTPQVGVSLSSPPPTGPAPVQVIAPRTPQSGRTPLAGGAVAGEDPFSGSTRIAPITGVEDPPARRPASKWLVGLFAVLGMAVLGLLAFAVTNGDSTSAAPPAGAESPSEPAATDELAAATPAEPPAADPAPPADAPSAEPSTPSEPPAAPESPAAEIAAPPTVVAEPTPADPQPVADSPLPIEPTPAEAEAQVVLASAPGTVTIRIEGTPASARVRAGSDVLCRELPCLLERPAGDGTESLRVSASGYADERIRISFAQSAVYVVSLEREARRETTDAPAEATEPEPTGDTPPPALPEVPLFVP